MTLNRDMLMKVGIVAAVTLIIYLVYRSRKCKDNYTEWVPTPEDYAEDRDEYHPQQDYAMEHEDYAEESNEYFEDQYEELYPQQVENYTLMESTLDDDQANAMFEPAM